ncbi:MAG: hypothetical protein GF313_07290 [Caldithrix sp.]|nr:hypothetical protein [Caldithrix sp.]
MKCIYGIFIGLLLIANSTLSGQNLNDDFLYGFLQGRYQLIGKKVTSDSTYYGQMEMVMENGHLKIIRTINSKAVKGTGQIAYATADSIAVLRCQFREDDQTYEATYQIDTDLDNYARLSGYVYVKNKPTPQPGLEAVFFDKSQF